MNGDGPGDIKAIDLPGTILYALWRFCVRRGARVGRFELSLPTMRATAANNWALVLRPDGLIGVRAPGGAEWDAKPSQRFALPR
jgi:hypothetical protein